MKSFKYYQIQKVVYFENEVVILGYVSFQRGEFEKWNVEHLDKLNFSIGLIDKMRIKMLYYKTLILNLMRKTLNITCQLVIIQ